MEIRRLNVVATFLKILTLLGILIFSLSAFSMNGRTTYQAKIVKPDGYPLEASSVNFRFTVLDTVGSCVLYVEDYAAVNMGQSGGLISFALGNGNRTFPASGTSQTFQNTFDNSVPAFSCQTPGIYNPGPNDTRKIVMQFNDGNGWQTLPAMTMNAVPYAMYATKSNDSLKLNNKADTAFVEYSTLAGLSCAADQAIKFNGVSFSCITVPAGGSGGITSVTTSGTVLTTGGTASAPVISITAASMSSDGYLTSLDYAEFKAKLSASSTQIINTLGYAPVSSSAVATQINNSNLSGDVSGTIGSNSVLSVGGKTSAQISTSVDDTLAATASATADTLVKRNSSGNATFNDIYANAAKINYVDIYKPSTAFNIRLQAPTSLAANYTLNLPTSSGTVGQVLSTDGSGNLSWVNPSTGSVTSVSATAPLVSTGGSTPTISITQATSSTDGYLSSSDFTTFSNKQNATSSAIIATLGYTPANATSATQWTTNGSNIYYGTGNIGAGVANPSAKLEIASGTASVAPLKFTSGTLLSSAQSGTMEYDGFNFYLTDSTNARRTIATGSSQGTIDNASNINNSSGNITMYPNSGNGSVIVSATTASTSSNTGALVVKGGLGVSGNINTAGNLNVSGSSVIDGTLKLSSMTSGSVLLAGANGTVTQDNSSLFWDGANKRLGIGTASPGYKLHVQDGPAVIKGTNSTLIIKKGAGSPNALSSESVASFDNESGAGVATNMFTNPGTMASIYMGDTGAPQQGYLRYLVNSAIPANQYLSLAVNSSERMRIDSSGNLGIGTSAPSANLEVSSSGAASTVRISSTAASNVLGAQTLGFGTMVSGVYTPTAIIGDTSGGDEAFKIFALRGNLSLGSNTSGTATTRMVVNQAGGVAIGSYVNDTPPVDGLILSGNVGIGTSSPGAKLDVAGDIRLRDGGSQISRNVQDGGIIILGGTTYGTDASLVTYGSTNAGNINRISANSDRFEVRNTAASTTKLVVDSSGNVGIGTAAPTARLHLAAGSATQAAFKLTSGTLLASPASGAVEYDGTNLYFTDEANTRRTLATITNSTGDFKADGSVSMTGQFKAVSGNLAAPGIIFANDPDTGFATTAPNTMFFVTGGLGTWLVTSTSLGTNAAGPTLRTANTQASPSIGWTFDGDTGFFNPLANMIAITTSGTEKMRIDSTGNVGIGTTSPSQLLSVNGAGHFDADLGVGAVADATIARLRVSANNTSAGLYVSQAGSGYGAIFNGGNVGIGTTTPSAKLHLAAGTSATASFKLTSGTLLTSPQSGTMEYDGSQFYLTDGANTRRTIATGSSAGTIDNASTINSTGNMSLVPVGSVIVSATTASTNSSTGALVVKGGLGVAGNIYSSGTIVTSSNIQGSEITATSATITPYVYGSVVSGGNITIDSTTHATKGNILLAPNGGNVGIGTIAPAYKLTVVGGDIALDRTSKLQFAGPVAGDSNRAYIAGNPNNDLIFGTGGAIEAMRILYTGNVGIGTTNPADKLHVNGNAILGSIPNYADAGSGLYLSNEAGDNFNYFRVDGYANDLALVASSLSGASVGTSISFRTSVAGEGANGSTKMTITGAGNVGIGTSSPNHKLEINGGDSDLVYTSSANVGVELRSTAGSAAQYIDFTGSSTSTVGSGSPDFQGRILYDSTAGADTMTFSTASSERLRITGTGNVGIGTATPVYKFSLYEGTGSVVANVESGNNGSAVYTRATGKTSGGVTRTVGAGLNISDSNGNFELYDFTAGTSRLYVNAVGNVGIGMLNPEARLDVSGSQVIRTDSAGYALFAPKYGTSVFGLNYDRFEIRVDTSTQVTNLGNAHGGTGSARSLALLAGGQERVRIDSGGNIGIGTSSPSTKLQVVDGTNNYSFSSTLQAPLALLKTDLTGPYAYVIGKAQTTNNTANFRYNHIADGSTSNYVGLGFWNNDDLFVVKASGNVGIGTSTPLARLDVHVNFSSPISGTVPGFSLQNDGNATSGSGMTIDTGQGTGLTNIVGGAKIKSDGTGYTYLGARGAARISLGDGSLSLFTGNTASGTTNGPVTWSGSGNTEALFINSSGNVGIGTTSPASKLHVNGDAQINAIVGGQVNGAGNFHLDAWTSGADRSVYLNWNNGTGGAKVGNGSQTWGPISASAFNTSSDQRLKENIRPIPYVLEKVMQLDPVTFTWKNESRHAQEGERLGLIAQNVEKVFPQAVRIDRGENTLPGGTKLVTYPDLIAPLIGAIKELYYRLVGHDGRLDGHDRQIASIAESKADKAEINQLRKDNAELKAYLCGKDPAAPICK